MGDRSWNYSNSVGRGRRDERSNYTSSYNNTYYDNHPSHGRSRVQVQQNFYTNTNQPFSAQDEPPIVRTFINSSYQPPPPPLIPQVKFQPESRLSAGPPSRHHESESESRNYHDTGGSSRHRHDSGSSSRHERDSGNTSRHHHDSFKSQGSGHRRDSRSSSHSRFYEDRSPRSEERRSPSRSYSSRSPSRYMNRSPPPGSKPRALPPNSNSPSYRRSEKRNRHESRESHWNRSSGHRSGSDDVDDHYTRRSHQSDVSKLVGLSPEVLKLMERLKEYLPWLSSRRDIIIDTGREKECDEEIEDIEWCLEVIQDINSSEKVGLQTMKRAQDVVLDLIMKNPVHNVFVADPVEDLGSPSVLLLDESESARSPSPGSSSLMRRRDSTLLNPRVIPTERAGLHTDWNYKPEIEKGVSPKATDIDYEHGLSKQHVPVEAMYERRKPPSFDTEFPASSKPYHGKEVPEVSHVIEGSGYGRSSTAVPKDQDMRSSERRNNNNDWEEDSEEEEGMRYEKLKRVEDQDMRVQDADQSSLKFPTVESPQRVAPIDRLAILQSPPTSDDFTPGMNMLGFPPNMINPLNPAHLHPSPAPAPAPPLPYPAQPMLNPFLNASVIAGMSGMTGMSAQQIISMQSQAQIMFGFQQQITNVRSGLLSTPTTSNPPNSTFSYQQPKPNNRSFRGPAPQAQMQPVQSQEPHIVESTQSVSITTTNSAERTQVMMSRIMAKAAQSFSQRGRGPVPRYQHPQTQFGRDRVPYNPSANSFYEVNHEHPVTGTPGSSATNPVSSSQPNNPAILDPRLKPRVPREPIQLPLTSSVQQATEKDTCPAQPFDPRGNMADPRLKSAAARLRESFSEKDNSSFKGDRQQSGNRQIEPAPQRIRENEKEVTPDSLNKSTRKEIGGTSQKTDGYRSTGPSNYRDKNSYSKDRSHSEAYKPTERDRRSNNYHRGVSRKFLEERDKSGAYSWRGRNSNHKAQPSMLPFETSVFRNSSETGLPKFRIPKIKKADPTPPPLDLPLADSEPIVDLTDEADGYECLPESNSPDFMGDRQVKVHLGKKQEAQSTFEDP